MEANAAVDGLEIRREGERYVRRRARREQALRLGSQAATTVLWSGRKEIRDPGRRRAATAGLVLGVAGLGLWEFNRSRVGTLWSERAIEQRPDLPAGETERQEPDRPDPDRPDRSPGWRTMLSLMTPRGKRLLILSGAMMLVQPLVRLGLRRSGIRYHRLASGLVAAGMHTAVGLSGIRNRPEVDDGEAPGELHDLLVDPIRLHIVAVVAPSTSVQLRLIRDATGLSEPVLLEQLELLSEAGIVELDRRRVGPARPRTWINLTRSGRQALTAHIAALTELARQAPKP